MKIASHEVSQTINHTLVRKEWEHESTFAWVGDDPRASQGFSRPPQRLTEADKVQISRNAHLLLSQTVIKPGGNDFAAEQVNINDAKTYSMLHILAILTGKAVEIATFSASEPTPAPQTLSISAPSSLPSETPPQRPEQVGWGLEYDYSKGEHEVETLEYTAMGSVVLEDGGEVQFDLSMAMGREYYSSTEVHIRAGDARLVDPLVINWGGQGVALEDQKFSFDLDADGELDSISLLKPGHGFLAVDWNGDGAINDGSELFGPESGNGFNELAEYDRDGNGWLDENDPLYEKLVVWSRDQAGSNELISLRQAGIGAIFLDGQDGLFSLNDTQNEQHGLVRETSFFLKEHGGMGTVQEVDFVV